MDTDTAPPGFGVLVAGAVVPTGTLVGRGPIGFGQDAPGRPEVPYTLHIRTNLLCELVGPTYDRFLDDALVDVGQFPDDWPELVAVIAAGCPPIERLPTMLPHDLAHILRSLLAPEMLDALLPPGGAAPARYLANTVDHLWVDPDWAAICGRALLSG
ncbi:hypothetical protein ACN27F_12955 [Solwaraspora sp. WMMB335]|uniref:hypothetical protein n=1 Tax=Solwaraspora sp. WMMB335 TaxID=3404118 RepID=UPI003B936492